jgi:16S rRNA (cytosine967-C5)-methyltransferase
VAWRVLKEWGAGTRHAADLVEAAAASRGMAGPDRAFMQDLVLTTLRNVTLLDHWIGVLTGGKALDAGTRWLVRSGLAEVLLLNVAEHAAVNENVGLAGRASGLVNAVLRRACRERRELLEGMGQLETEVRCSHPVFLLERWRQ